jgi:predicted Fe-Mo cluster-binding NifX family protein
MSLENGEGTEGVNSRVSAVPETKRSVVEGVAETETGIRDAEVCEATIGSVARTGEGGGASDTFGKANNTGRAFTFVETRSVEKCCQGGLHAPGRFKAVAENLADCQVILCEQIGPGALRAMEAAGFVVFEVDAPVAGALEALASKLHVLGL